MLLRLLNGMKGGVREGRLGTLGGAWPLTGRGCWQLRGTPSFEGPWVEGVKRGTLVKFSLLNPHGIGEKDTTTLVVVVVVVVRWSREAGRTVSHTHNILLNLLTLGTSMSTTCPLQRLWGIFLALGVQGLVGFHERMRVSRGGGRVGVVGEVAGG